MHGRWSPRPRGLGDRAPYCIFAAFSMASSIVPTM